jgi:hypothetical protein
MTEALLMQARQDPKADVAASAGAAAAGKEEDR